MSKIGSKWSREDLLDLYALLSGGDLSLSEVAEALSRTPKAVKIKALQGGLCNEDYILYRVFPSEQEFLEAIFGGYRKPKPKPAPRLKPGKMAKVFNKACRALRGMPTLPVNKRALVPALDKWSCKRKHKGSDAWWRFAHHAQANPYMRSMVYRREEGMCALCARALSEADYQAHHSCYDHVCTYKKSIAIIDQNGDERIIPDCESCALKNAEGFQACFARLHAVHGLCNKRLND